MKAEKEQRAKEEAEQRKAASLAPRICVVAEEVLSEEDATAREEQEKIARRAANTEVPAADGTEQIARAELQEQLIAEEEVNAIAPRKVESGTTDIALALPMGFFDNQDDDDRIHRRLTKEQRTKLLSEKTAVLRDETERIRVAEAAVDKGDDDDGIDAELRVDPEENVIPAVQTSQVDFLEVRKLVMDAHDLEKDADKEGETATEDEVDADELLSWKSKSLWWWGEGFDDERAENYSSLTCII